MMGKKVERCALYLRLSKEDEGRKESASIENQRKILREFAEVKGFSVSGEYVDDGFSGTNLNRPAFQQMLEDIEKGKINIVLTKDLSRLGRNSGRVSMMLDEYFPKHRVRYISVSEGIDTAEQSAMHHIVAPVQNLVNELYAGDISRKIRASLYMKMQEGDYIGAFAPYGYQKDPQDKNHLLVDQEAAEVVRRMFALAEKGTSPSEIAEMFQEEGILTPSLYRYEKYPQLDRTGFRGTAEWKVTNIRKMLRNEVYLGHTLQGKTVRPSFKSSCCYGRPKEEWVIVRNTHEALVDEETWKKVREWMKKRSKRR
ncbi:MAG: recombinase family protein [Anaerotignum sp.]|nr:recombinase family protein [Anaerotignum sp.]